MSFEQIDPDTLADLKSSRIRLLENLGLDYQRARLFANLEHEKRLELEGLAGPHAALLARLEWVASGEWDIRLRFVLDNAPWNLAKRALVDFDPLPTPPSFDDLLG
jgi:hypothetical protein